jgi:hypothetical protein
LGNFKIVLTHPVSSLNKTPKSSEESPLSTKKLSQMKYPKEELKKVKGVMKRKIFNRQQW